LQENGLYRDPYTHKITNAALFELYKSPVPAAVDSAKATICHRTSSKKNPLVEIDVPASSLQTHFDHGDYIGTCKEAAADPTFKKSDSSALHYTAVQDPKCNKVTSSCRPVAIISADKLRDIDEGPASDRTYLDAPISRCVSRCKYGFFCLTLNSDKYEKNCEAQLSTLINMVIVKSC
jgi:hypothetical protein